MGWKIFLLQVFIAGFVALAGYMIYLDGKMKHVFANIEFPHPIQIQARPLIITSGANLTITEFIDELKANNYQKVATPMQAGEFSASSKKVEVYLKANAQTSAATRKVMVEFTKTSVASINAAGKQVNSVALPGAVMAKIWPKTLEDRTPLKLKEIPQSLIEILLWTEDRSFYSHFGVNPLAIARAIAVNITAGRTVQGGSTLTQQLAKNLILTNDRTLIRKINDALLAILMEWHFGKDLILQTYMNEVYLGQIGATSIHGFASASEFYFGKSLQDLTIDQQVTLVAMVKGPSFYNPWKAPEKLLERRNVLLKSLADGKKIKPQTLAAGSKAPLGVLAKGHIGSASRPALANAVKMQLEAKNKIIAELKSIQTTIDPISQRAAENAVITVIPLLEKQHKIKGLQVAVLAVDRTSGAVRAIVSDRNPSYPGYNRALLASRPIGSLIKPFIFLSALRHKADFNLATQLSDRPVSMRSQSGQRWNPKNFSGKFSGSVNATNALASSLNVPFVNLGMQVGLEKIHGDLQRLTNKKIDSLYPSDLLGSISLSPWQVAQLYNNISSGGVHQQLYLLSAIQDPSAWQSITPPQKSQILNSALTYQLLFAMQQVSKIGTAKALNGMIGNNNLAAKTGTTNNYRDTWFVGIDGRELVVIWVGKDDNQPTKLTGSKGAMQVYAAYQKQRVPQTLTLAASPQIYMQGFDAKGRAVAKGCPHQYFFPVESGKIKEVLGCSSAPANSNKSWWERIF